MLSFGSSPFVKTPNGGNIMRSDVLFQDMHQSTLRRASKISPQVQGVTLGPNASPPNAETSRSEQFMELPQQASTPIKSKKLSDNVLRRPRRLSNYNLNVSKLAEEAVRKTKMAEISKQQTLEADKLVTNLETETKATEKKFLDRLRQQYLANQTKREAQTELIGNTILQKMLTVKEAAEKEDQDKVEETKAAERIEKAKQNVEEAKKKCAALAEKKKMEELMKNWQTSYTDEYIKVTESLDKCKHLDIIKDEIIPVLQTVQDDGPILKSLQIKCAAEQLTFNDLKTADLLMKNLIHLYNTIKNESKKVDDAIAENARIEEEKKVEEEENKKKITATKETSQETSSLSDCFDTHALANYAKYRQHLQTVNMTLEPLFDPSLSKYRFQVQKAVTMTANAISGATSSHMLDKYNKLHNLLSGKPADQSMTVSPSQHPLGTLFVKAVLAKLFVRQGEMAVKPEAAFEIASIIVNLWSEFPDFGELVMAHMYEHCPYLAPIFLPQIEGQSNEDFYKSLGYIVKNGEIEKENMFMNRMRGLMRLFAAVIITKPRNPAVENPLTLKEAWRWLAAMLNLVPRPDICPLLVLEMLTVAGHDLLASYRGQAAKVLMYINKDYIPLIDQVTPSVNRGPLTRLENFLEEVSKIGTIEAPHHRLAPNFW